MKTLAKLMVAAIVLCTFCASAMAQTPPPGASAAISVYPPPDPRVGVLETEKKAAEDKLSEAVQKAADAKGASEAEKKAMADTIASLKEGLAKAQGRLVAAKSAASSAKADVASAKAEAAEAKAKGMCDGLPDVEKGECTKGLVEIKKSTTPNPNLLFSGAANKLYGGVQGNGGLFVSGRDGSLKVVVNSPALEMMPFASSYLTPAAVPPASVISAPPPLGFWGKVLVVVLSTGIGAAAGTGTGFGLGVAADATGAKMGRIVTSGALLGTAIGAGIGMYLVNDR